MEAVEILRSIPTPVFFYGFVLLLLALVLFILGMRGMARMAQRDTERSVDRASKVASSLWHVSGETTIKDGWAVMRFSHLSWPNQNNFILPVGPEHPDIEQFRQLKDGDTVEFEALQEGMDCSLEHELFGFLRIRSVS